MSAGQVTVIMLNFNGADHLRQSLPSVVGQDHPGVRVVVVDNGSDDDSESVASSFPVDWLPLHRNYGFAPAINKAVAQTSGDVLVLVNNDMRFPPEFVREIVAPLSDPTVFASDALQYDWSGATLLHGATQLFRGSLRSGGPGKLLPRLRFEQFLPDEVTEVAFACGGNMAVTRRRFEDLGGFNEALVTSWEDLEICWRAALKGWRSVLNPAAYCWHRVGGTNRDGAGADYHLRGSVQGGLIFPLLHLPVSDVVASWARATLGLIIDTGALRFRRAATRARAIRSAVAVSPSSLLQRRRLYAMANTTPRANLAQRLTVTPRAINAR